MENKKLTQFRFDSTTREQIEQIASILAHANPLEKVKVSKTRVVEIAIEKLYKDLAGDIKETDGRYLN